MKFTESKMYFTGDSTEIQIENTTVPVKPNKWAVVLVDENKVTFGLEDQTTVTRVFD